MENPALRVPFFPIVYLICISFVWSSIDFPALSTAVQNQATAFTDDFDSPAAQPAKPWMKTISISEEGPVPRGLASPSAPFDGGTLFHHRATARSQRPDGKISTRGLFDATCGGPPLKPEILNI